MKLLLALGLLPLLQDRAERFLEGLRFAEAEAETDVGRRVVEQLKDPRHWLDAHRAIESRLGPMREGIDLAVSFDYDGEDVAKATARDRSGRIRFNLRRLEDYQARLDEFEKKKKEAAARGLRLVFKVEPSRIDRLIWHELVHVFHGDYDAPDWFTEGLAQWLSEDPSAIQAYAHRGRGVGPIETTPADKLDIYGRGHLFWSWIAARGGVKRAVQSTVLQGVSWKAGLEKSLGLSWATISDAERDWSARHLDEVRAKQK